MSAHDDFTLWIDKKAEFIETNGKKYKILDTYFTGNGIVPNSDRLVIKIRVGTKIKDLIINDLRPSDLQKLFQRFEKYQEKNDPDYFKAKAGWEKTINLCKERREKERKIKK
jgi:hypothetical protein